MESDPIYSADFINAKCKSVHGNILALSLWYCFLPFTAKNYGRRTHSQKWEFNVLAVATATETIASTTLKASRSHLSRSNYIMWKTESVTNFTEILARSVFYKDRQPSSRICHKRRHRPQRVLQSPHLDGIHGVCQEIQYRCQVLQDLEKIGKRGKRSVWIRLTLKKRRYIGWHRILSSQQ